MIFFIVNIIIVIIIFKVLFSLNRRYFSVLCKEILIKLISIGSYFPEVHAFGTLITSTEVFRLIFCKII